MPKVDLSYTCFATFIGPALEGRDIEGRDIVLRIIIEYSSFKRFCPPVN